MTSEKSSRAGRYQSQPGGYRAFIPNSIRRRSPVDLSHESRILLSNADQALGRLDGTTEVLPHPDLFVSMYSRREAVLSSQIEGTQASLDDLFRYESDHKPSSRAGDVDEIANYLSAMNFGLDRLDSLPLSTRLIKEIHAQLLVGARGHHRAPGELRKTQNWIGPPGSTIQTAVFVPPPPSLIVDLLGDLELFLHDEDPIPVLLKSAIAHAQFEMIHPFLDGNGRVGRLLITFILCWQGSLRRPLLYLSHFFHKNRAEYYQRLQAVHEQDDWEGWIEFFLKGVAEVANDATTRARLIHQFLQKCGDRLPGTSPHEMSLLKLISKKPFLKISTAADLLGISYPTANKLIGQFEDQGLLQEITGGPRNRVYRFGSYLDLLATDRDQ